MYHEDFIFCSRASLLGCFIWMQLNVLGLISSFSAFRVEGNDLVAHLVWAPHHLLGATLRLLVELLHLPDQKMVNLTIRR